METDGQSHQKLHQAREDGTDPVDALENLMSKSGVGRNRLFTPEKVAQISSELAPLVQYTMPLGELDETLRNDRVTALLAPIADTLDRDLRLQWWKDGIAFAQQVAVVRPGQEPPITSSDHGAERLAEWFKNESESAAYAVASGASVATGWTGEWWSYPRIEGFTSTTRSLNSVPAVELLFEEDGFSFDRAQIVEVFPRPAARMYEVRSTTDWTKLVDRFPLEVTNSRSYDWQRFSGVAGRWFIPHWSAVSAEYDAIHVNVGAYLSTAGVPLKTRNGYSLLSGWNPDQTLWLREDAFTLGGSTSWTSA